jgi:two-component system cell cycle sensor histidine kinase/response regulator CckA
MSAPETDGTRKLILIVEDDSQVRLLASKALQRLGYDVLEAEDGVHALEALEADPEAISLVFSDVRMPRMTGTELAESVVRRWPKMKLLLTSGHARSEDYGYAYSVLPKPYSRQQLSEAIQLVLK